MKEDLINTIAGVYRYLYFLAPLAFHPLLKSSNKGCPNRIRTSGRQMDTLSIPVTFTFQKL